MAGVSQAETSRSSGIFAWFLPLFVGSGCAALIYEIVWFQSLQLVIGASAVSLGVLLATFMGGMCLGSLIFPAVVPQSWHPLRVYAILEIAIGISAVLILYFLPSVEAFYLMGIGRWLSTPGQSTVFLRAAVAASCLLPPTILMGATLPAIARWFESNPRGAFQTGMFYSANIFGAVLGCLGASFYLLRLHDMVFATYVAVAINGIVALVGLAASFFFQYPLVAEEPSQELDAFSDAARTELAGHDGPGQRERWTVLTAIGLSGLAALGAEVIWTRELSLLLGASVYTFSLILAVFLVALGIGSSLGSAWARGSSSPALPFALCQLGAALGVCWAAWLMADSLPYWPIDVSLATNPWLTFQLDIVRVAWAVFPAALCWGTSFPLALATVAGRRDPAKLVSGVYAANTLGAIVGAIGASWIALPSLGVQRTHQLLVLALLLSALLLLALPVRKMGALMIARLASGAMIVVVVMGVIALPKPPVGLAAYGRYLATWLDSAPQYLYSADGLSASIAVSEFNDGVRNFHVSGKVVASSEPLDMRLQRMLGHLPALLAGRPKSVLIVGCGAGVTAGTFVVHPSIERIVICEIEPLIPRAAGNYFGQYNHHVIQDPRLQIVLDDARHFLLTTDEKFDIITSDPIHPWVKGAAALYSKEYFDLTRDHLKPDGIATQWVPLYESSLEAVKSEIATFLESFPDGTLWTNDDESGGYDLVMLGQASSTKVDLERLQERLVSPDYQQVLASLKEVQLGSALALAKTYGGNKADLKDWLSDAVVNTDQNLRLQYSAGWALNNYTGRQIRASMLPFVRYPEDLFVGDKQQLAILKFWVERESTKAKTLNTPRS